MCLFKSAVVYRICQYCEQEHIYGCHNFGELRECKSCLEKCSYEKQVFSEREYQIFLKEKNTTFGACNESQSPEIILARASIKTQESEIRITS